MYNRKQDFFFPLKWSVILHIYSQIFFQDLFPKISKVMKLWSYFSYFSVAILCRHVHAIILDCMQDCFRPMAQFPSYFYIISWVVHLTMSKFVCSKLCIFLLSLKLYGPLAKQMLFDQLTSTTHNCANPLVLPLNTLHFPAPIGGAKKQICLT